MSHHASRRACLVIPIALVALAGCADTDTMAPRLGWESRLAQGDGGVWTVNSLVDPGSGGCDDTECTLREAIAAAASGDQVVFANGLQGTVLLTSGQLVIDKNLSVDGGGGISIDGGDVTRVMHVSAGTVRLAGLTFTEGNASTANGGGILVGAANLTLDGTTLLSNEGIAGGGIYVEPTGTVTAENSTFQFNFATRSGAIDNRGTFTLRDSWLLLNEALTDGSQIVNYGMLVVEGSTIGGSFYHGIINEVTGNATIARSTIYGNAATGSPGRGAGLHNLGVMHVRSSTVAENIAPSGIGGIYNAGTMTAMNTIVISNNGNPECGGPVPVASLGFNLSTPTGGCAFTQATDISIDLALAYTNLFEGALSDNGGPTPTLALEPGGLAEDKGSCSGQTQDQRGFARPVDNPLYANADDGCDIGAYEIQLTPGQKVTVVTNAVDALALPKGLTTSLQSKLATVEAAIGAGDIAGACNGLTAFINAVNAQAGKKIPASDAANLVAMANDLRASLGCA